jgi:class 3 adenylate cyclase
MPLLDEIRDGVQDILDSRLNVREARVIPHTEDITLLDEGVEFEGTVMFSDLAESTTLGTDLERRTAAKVFKAFLYSCTKIITGQGGRLTSFEGDRVMGVFMGDTKNSDAVTSALRINYVVHEVLSPLLHSHFLSLRQAGFQIQQGTGIDTGRILVVRAGQRNANDLVWVSKATGFADRLSGIREDPYRTFISADVFNVMRDSVKSTGQPPVSMWEQRSYLWRGEDRTIYRSHYYWRF